MPGIECCRASKPTKTHVSGSEDLKHPSTQKFLRAQTHMIISIQPEQSLRLLSNIEIAGKDISMNPVGGKIGNINPASQPHHIHFQVKADGNLTGIKIVLNYDGTWSSTIPYEV